MIPLLLVAQLALVQTPTVTERVDQVLIIGSISLSSVALGLTMACTSTGECRELNPVMRKFIGDGPVGFTLVKASANAGATYAAWRLTKGKTRTILLGTLFAVNALDAIHDVHQMRKLRR